MFQQTRERRRRDRQSARRERTPRLESLEARSLLASFTTLEDTPLTIDIPAEQTARIVVEPRMGGVRRIESGDLLYTPGQNSFGSDSFVYRVGDGDAARETVSITITPVNEPPRLQYPILRYEVSPGIPYNSPAKGVLEYASSPDFETLRASLVEGPAHGTLTLNADGSFVYQSNANYFGLDHFTYRVSEGSAATDSVTGRVTLVVRPAIDFPRANDDYYATPQDTVLSVATPGVLANDGHTLPVSLVRGPARGTVVLNANGGFVYTPPAGFNGVETFTYRILDPAASTYPFNQGGLSEEDEQAWRSVRPLVEATVTIRVGTIVNHPNAVNDSYALRKDTELAVVAPGVLANDVGHSNASRLSAALVDGPKHGTLTLNADGSFHYKPSAGFVGIDVFAYRAEDAADNSLPHDHPEFNISVARVSLYVMADSPLLAQDDNFAAEQNKPLTVAAPGVLGNDIGSGRRLAATLLTRPEHGTLVFNADGSFTYTPAADFYGVDRFTYRARDAGPTPAGANAASGLSSIATVSLYVRPTKLPLIVRDDHYVAKQNTVLEVAAPGVLSNDYILDVRPPPGPWLGGTHPLPYMPPPISATLVAGPERGTLTLNADGSFRYTPAPDFIGQVKFTYRGRWENGLDDPAYSDIGEVMISVHPTERTPVARDDSYVGFEDTPLEVRAPGVLANDERSAGTAFVPVVSTPPSFGTLTLNADGSFRYVPDAGFNGSDFFSYRSQQPATTASGQLGSNTAGVWLHIRPNNPVVQAYDDRYSTTVEAQLKVEAPGVLKNDVTIPILGAETGGVLRVLYPVPVGPLPTTLTVSLVRGPSYGTLTLNADGSFTYTPRGDFAGIDTFRYKASAAPVAGGAFLIDDGIERPDNGQPPEILPHDIATVTINVIPRDQGAVVARDNEYRLKQDTALTIAAPGVLGNDYLLSLDPTADNGTRPQGNLSAVLAAGPEHGKVTLHADGSFTYTPAAGYVGADRFTYRATDGTHSDEATVFLRVVATLPAPRFVIGPHQQITDEGGFRSIDRWTVPERGNPASGTTPSFEFHVTTDRPELFAVPPTIDASGNLTYAPAANASGAATVTVVLRDAAGVAVLGEGESVPQTFTITVTKPNPLHNTRRALDVDNNGTVAPLDAVLIINYLNGKNGGIDVEHAVESSIAAGYLDTSKNNAIGALDAVLVINHLNSLAAGVVFIENVFLDRQPSQDLAASQAAEGEAAPADWNEVLSLIAAESAAETARKRRR